MKHSSGRKAAHKVHSYFVYDVITEKSKCLLCDTNITSKNPTNLTRHIDAKHPDEAKLLVEQEKSRKIVQLQVQHQLLSSSGFNQFSGDSSSKFISSQPSVAQFFKQGAAYSEASVEYLKKRTAMVDLFVAAKLPLRLLDVPEWNNFCKAMDPKFQTLGRKRMARVLMNHFETEKSRIAALLSQTRCISIGMDIWSKKSLSASFLGISACFYCLQTKSAQHVFLNLIQVNHPHTGKSIAEHLDSCLQASNNSMLVHVSMTLLYKGFI